MKKAIKDGLAHLRPSRSRDHSRSRERSSSSSHDVAGQASSQEATRPNPIVTPNEPEGTTRATLASVALGSTLVVPTENPSPHPDDGVRTPSVPNPAMSEDLPEGQKSSGSGTTWPKSTPAGDAPGSGPHAVSKDLWERAAEQVQHSEDWKKYKQTVGRDLQSASTISISEAIATIAQSARAEAESGKMNVHAFGTTIVFRDIFDKIITCMNAVKDIGTGTTSVNPYASLAWGGVQFFVKAAVTNSQVRELCWEGLERIVYLISRYKIVEELYLKPDLTVSRELLEEALVKLYASMLNYQIIIVNYTSSRLDRFKAAFQDKSESGPQKLLDDIQKQDIEVIRVQGLVDQEVSNTYHRHVTDMFSDLGEALKNLDQPIRKMLRCIEKVSQICEGQRKAQVLHWVSPVKYENPHHAKEAMSGTGRWLLQDAKYRGWRRASQSSTLWLQGFMGSGKSCLAHVVIEDLRKASATADGEKIAFFYCDGTTQEQASQITNVISILRCLLKQLSDFGIEKRLPNLVVKAYDENSLKVDLTEQESLSLILQMVTVYPSTILVIDGLDECPTEVQRKLVSNINEILRRSPTLVKVFISSRPTPEIVDLLEPLEVTEITTLENNTRDIEDLVIHEVAEAASSPGLRKLYHRGKNSHKEAVIDKLLVNAQGMFRWVQLSLIYLHGSANFFELGERLHQISQLEGLFELYDLIYKRMMDNRDEKNGIAIRTILLFLLYGKAVHDEYLDRKRHLVGEPSRLHSALEAASFAANLSDVIYKAEDIVALCPSFLSLEETSTHSKLALPHFSVKEYLTTKHSDLYSPQNGNAFIAELCIQAFIKLNLEDLRVLPNFALYSATYWASHLLELGFINGERDSIDRILSGRVSLQAAFRSFILESQATESFQLWTTYMDEQRQRSRFPASYLVTSPPSSLFARLFLDCGWSSPDQSEAALNVKTDFGMTSIQFATVLGNTKAVEWLAKHGLDVNAQDSSGQNALFYAFLLALPVVDVYHFRWLGNLKFNRRTRIEHTVRTLVRLGVNVNFRSHRGSTALHFIAADCDEATTSCLLENGADIYAQDSDGQTPLHAYVAESKKSSPMFRYFIAQPPLLAMANNFGETVLHLVQDPLIEELLAKVSDCEPRNIHGATPLHYAVRNDDRKKVAALLARHVDVNAQTKDGCSVLHIAAERYRRSSLMTALETLISAGANGNLKTRDGKTPLHYYYLVIVGNRGDYFRGELHEQILQMFLEAGVDPNAVDDAGMVARDYLDGSSSMLIDRHLRVTEMRGFKK